MPVTSNVYMRTFQFRFGDSSGTCFTLDVESRQYIVTAKHLVKAITGAAIIYIKHDQEWKNLPVNLVGHGEGDVDISVLAADIPLSSEKLNLPATGDIIIGQDVYFVGFPYGLATEVGQMNNDFPLPFIKKALFSSWDNEAGVLYLDGFNNRGFSGGPVVFRTRANVDFSVDFSVAAVISGYRYEIAPVYLGDSPTSYQIKNNTGIIVSYDIKYALDLIRCHPIGFDLRLAQEKNHHRGQKDKRINVR